MRAAAVASLCLALASLPLHAVRASAAVTLTLEQVDKDGPPKPVTMYLDADKFRLAMESQDVIYRGDQDRLWVVRRKARTYLEITPESLSKVSSAMQGAMAAMQDKLAKLPDAQRKQVEAMMAAHAGGAADAAPPAPKYERLGADKTVGDWTCSPIRAATGAASTELCIAKLEDLGLTPDDIKPFASFSNFILKMRRPAGLRMPSPALDFAALRKAAGFDGFPVESATDLGRGKRVLTTTVKSISHETLPAGTFDLPEGYAKQDLGAMFGGAMPVKP